MTLPNIEITTNFEKSLCYDCPDFIEEVKRLDRHGRPSNHSKNYYVPTIRCKKTNGFPVPRMRCEWRVSSGNNKL